MWMCNVFLVLYSSFPPPSLLLDEQSRQAPTMTDANKMKPEDERPFARRLMRQANKSGYLGVE